MAGGTRLTREKREVRHRIATGLESTKPPSLNSVMSISTHRRLSTSLVPLRRLLLLYLRRFPPFALWVTGSLAMSQLGWPAKMNQYLRFVEPTGTAISLQTE